ncbi:putative MarR family transcriptional regulator [Oscillibacter valericigenes Sjm18-20]|nr:putative MarR family transcriptional regulator [Oscillibacter valericigenes Sjm18-20]
MNQSRVDELHQINYLTSEMDALYHKSSLKLGITDSVSIVLYSIHDAGESSLLSDIYKRTGINKQTVNSAVRNLEADGMLYLEQHIGRTKAVILTDKGKAFVKKTIVKLCEAEAKAFDSWSADEVNTYIRLMEKYVCCFRQQIEALETVAK